VVSEPQQQEAELSKRLYHFSSDPIVAVGDVAQRNVNPYNDHGWYPRGLWFAPGTSWREASVDFRDASYFAKRYEVRIGADARIADLATAEMAAEFTDRFGGKPYNGDVLRVRWEDVAKHFDGIRLGFHPRSYLHRVEGIGWTEAWDIESGCIWNFENVDIVNRAGAVLPKKPVHEHWLERYEDAEHHLQPMKCSAWLMSPDGDVSLLDVEELDIVTGERF
jgi:hypothetical protein